MQLKGCKSSQNQRLNCFGTTKKCLLNFWDKNLPICSRYGDLLWVVVEISARSLLFRFFITKTVPKSSKPDMFWSSIRIQKNSRIEYSIITLHSNLASDHSLIVTKMTIIKIKVTTSNDQVWQRPIQLKEARGQWDSWNHPIRKFRVADFHQPNWLWKQKVTFEKTDLNTIKYKSQKEIVEDFICIPFEK